MSSPSIDVEEIWERGKTYLISGAFLLDIGKDYAYYDVITRPRVMGGAARTNARALLIQSHGCPGKSDEIIRKWTDAIQWRPGVYVNCSRDNPIFTGLTVLIIEDR